MDEDGFFVEFFAAKTRPDESEKEAHEENNDRFCGVGGDGGERDGGSESETESIG